MTTTKYATYKTKYGSITKDGHTMFTEDIAKDLNRKSHLECVVAELGQIIRYKDTEIAELRGQKFKRFNDQEYWIYQGDGEDYPESLVCPVVMSAEQLREMLAKIENFESIINNSEGVSGFHQNGDVALWGEFEL